MLRMELDASGFWCTFCSENTTDHMIYIILYMYYIADGDIWRYALRTCQFASFRNNIGLWRLRCQARRVKGHSGHNFQRNGHSSADLSGYRREQILVSQDARVTHGSKVRVKKGIKSSSATAQDSATVWSDSAIGIPQLGFRN